MLNFVWTVRDRCDENWTKTLSYRSIFKNECYVLQYDFTFISIYAFDVPGINVCVDVNVEKAEDVITQK